MEREKLIFVDNSYLNVYVGGVGESLQRKCRVRLRLRLRVILSSTKEMENVRKGYETRIPQDLLTDAITGKNRIKLYQQHFQKKDGLPVYLKGRYGVPMTRFMLWGATIGCLATLGVVGLMATNNLPKKQR